MGPGRLHALIDGVFAIALTLLVLDLPKPLLSTHLVHDLLHQWPSYVAYLVSFVTIGLLWIEHHGMMSAVRRIDRRFLELTLAFLLFISVVPWPTALAANYVDRGFSEARAVAILYAATMLLMGLTFTWGWRYLATHPELVAEPARPAFPAGTRRALLGALVYLVAVAVAFVSPLASFAIDGAVAVYFAALEEPGPGVDRPVGWGGRRVNRGSGGGLWSGPAGCGRSGGDDGLEVLHHREGVVEVVERSAPVLVPGRAPEALRVILQALPFDEEQEAAGPLHATLHAERDETGAGGDDRRGLLHRLDERLPRVRA